MAIDLADLVPSLRRQVTPPGSTLYTEIVDSVLVGYLSDAFWEGKVDGFYDGFDESDGIVVPESGTTDLTRDWQQLIVFYASIAIISTELRSTNTVFRSKAGPVEYETQNSAQLLRDLLRMLAERRDYLLETLSSKYNISAGYVDLVTARSNAVIYGDYNFESGVRFTEMI